MARQALAPNYTESGATSTGSVPRGPRWYRSRIRTIGPFAALVPPAVIGLVGLGLLRIGESRPTGAIGLVTGLWAAPGLMVLGVPLSDSSSYALGIGISVVAWLLVGLMASRRATADPMASWPQYWRHYAWAGAGVLAGVAATLFVVGVIYGEALL